MAKKIGEFLLDLGVLTEKQVAEVLRYAKSTGMRFGEAAVKLGFLRSESPIKSFGASFSVDFFHLQSEYFPEVTRDVLKSEDIVRLGALPLGFKNARKFFRATKTLNVGFLDPSRKEAIAEVERLAKASHHGDFSSLKVYLILADEFLEVLESVYKIPADDLRERNASQMDRTFYEFLESIAINPS